MTTTTIWANCDNRPAGDAVALRNLAGALRYCADNRVGGIGGPGARWGLRDMLDDAQALTGDAYGPCDANRAAAALERLAGGPDDA